MDTTVSELINNEEFRRTMFLYSATLREMNTKIQIINDEFTLKHTTNPIEHIKSRLKTPESILGKLRRRGYKLTLDNALSYIDDIAGMRIICSFTKDIYTLSDIIASQSDITILKIKDYIAIRRRTATVVIICLLTCPFSCRIRKCPHEWRYKSEQ